MRIKYNILWFEDIRESFDTKKIFVSDIVEELGFIFPEPQWEVDGENIDKLDYSEFDLIIADLNLSNVKGPNLIKKIRDMDVYTEVIFYSSDGEDAVRAALRDSQIDGAYCAGRSNEDFEEKVKKVIKTTVKKVQDLNNMRGLIMAETSDIDHLMLKIISRVVEKKIAGVTDKIIEAIFTNVSHKVVGKVEDFDKYKRNTNIGRILKDHVMFDSSEKIKIVQVIIDLIEHELTQPHKQNTFATNYSALKQTRDLLAHVIEDYKEGRKILRSGEREIEFTDDLCIKLRQDVRKHNKDLEAILRMLD